MKKVKHLKNCFGFIIEAELVKQPENAISLKLKKNRKSSINSFFLVIYYFFYTSNEWILFVLF
jgi:hypothetical protein